MAEINLGNENEINVNISTDTKIGATVPDINYIPGYQIAEEERRANEVIRQSNEADRIALYEDMENKLATGYFDGVGLNYDWEGTSLGVKREDESEYSYTDLKGDTGNDGVSPSASVTRGTGSATITVTDASGTTTAVIYDGEKGEKGDPGAIKTQVVQELPTTGAEDTIYLVPITPDTSGNNYAEYMYINGAWELLGKIGIATDLTDYVKNTDYASLSKAGVVKTNSYSGFNVNNGGGALCDSVTYSQYEGRINDSFISKGTLENVITGKGLVSSSSLSSVATSGSYNDLTNKPTIPSISDEYGTSTTDGYSQNYLNENTLNPNGNATTTSENTSFNLTNTLEAPLLIDLKGNTSQTGTPTPSSPIPVNVVSGDNDIVVEGKNLFDNSHIEVGKSWYGTSNSKRARWYLKLSAGTEYTIKMSDFTNISQIAILETTSISESGKQKWETVRTAPFTQTHTFSNDAIYLVIQFESANDFTREMANNIKLMLNYGDSVLPYEPYNGTTYNIDLPEGMELCKIGTYQDYIYKENDKWYLHKEIGKVVLDGTQNLSVDAQHYRCYMSYSNYGVGTIIRSSDGYCNLLVKGNSENTPSFNFGGAQFFIRIDNSLNSATAFNNYFATNNLILLGVLATPTNTEITYTPLIEQLNTLEEAQSKEGTTNINQVNNDLPFILNITAFLDTYDGRYEALDKRVSDNSSSIQVLNNEVDSLINYSTTEQVIGKWIDGKPLYRKVIDFGTLPNNNSISISSGLTASTTRITKISGVARDNTSGYCVALPHISTNGLGSGIQLEFNTSGAIFIRTQANYSSLNGYVILEYTKTTD